MTKDQLQKELKEKVKEGVKPSHLKKLKRSKSADDIPQTPLKSSEPSITQLQEQVKFHSQTAANYLKSLQTSQAKVSELETQVKNNPPLQLLQDQLSEKQKEVESLRQQLETKPALTELDNSLFARHKSLKDWFTQYQKTKQLDTELKENIEEASQELISQDQTISQLRTELHQLKLTNQSLQKDLNLATKLAQSRKVPYPLPEDKGTYLKYGLYSLIALTFIIWLTKS